MTGQRDDGYRPRAGQTSRTLQADGGRTAAVGTGRQQDIIRAKSPNTATTDGTNYYNVIAIARAVVDTVPNFLLQFCSLIAYQRKYRSSENEPYAPSLRLP